MALFHAVPVLDFWKSIENMISKSYRGLLFSMTAFSTSLSASTTIGLRGDFGVVGSCKVNCQVERKQGTFMLNAANQSMSVIVLFRRGCLGGTSKSMLLFLSWSTTMMGDDGDRRGEPSD